VPSQGKNHTATGNQADRGGGQHSAHRAYETRRWRKTAPLWVKIDAVTHFYFRSDQTRPKVALDFQTID
jgi:hypothetical protein